MYQLQQKFTSNDIKKNSYDDYLTLSIDAETIKYWIQFESKDFY